MSEVWNYGRVLPPERWHEAFPLAADRRQSPIELYRAQAIEDPDKAELIQCYKATDDELCKSIAPEKPCEEQDDPNKQPKPLLKGFFLEDHHFEAELEEDADAGGIKIGEVDYKLKKFHVHTPSEHLIEGQMFEMEIHLVHTAEVAGVTRVVAVGIMVKKAAKDSPLITLFDRLLPLAKLPEESKEESKRVNFSTSKSQSGLTDGYPAQRSYFRYTGSLTTPPCTGGVIFYMFDHPVGATEKTINKFAKHFPGGNNRPIQALNGREVYYHVPSSGGGSRSGKRS